MKRLAVILGLIVALPMACDVENKYAWPFPGDAVIRTQPV